MTPDELRLVLAGYRTQVEQAWSEKTAHQYHKGLPGAPDGQCGVTSAWLQERLRDNHAIDSLYCIGSAYALGVSEPLEHCWLEIGGGWDRIIVDLTADQIPGLYHPVCSTYGELCGMRISYIATRKLDYQDVLLDPVMDRLALLKVAL